MTAVKYSVDGCSRKLQPILKVDPKDRATWFHLECDVCHRPACEKHSSEVEGKISGLTGTGTCPVLKFSVNTTKVSTDATTEFSGGKCEQLVNDMKVEVKGTRQSDGSVKAAKVKLEDSGKK